VQVYLHAFLISALDWGEETYFNHHQHYNHSLGLLACRSVRSSSSSKWNWSFSSFGWTTWSSSSFFLPKNQVVVFWILAPCNDVKETNISEVLAVSVFSMFKCYTQFTRYSLIFVLRQNILGSSLMSLLLFYQSVYIQVPVSGISFPLPLFT
jgi:hypothetical protein